MRGWIKVKAEVLMEGKVKKNVRKLTCGRRGKPNLVNKKITL